MSIDVTVNPSDVSPAPGEPSLIISQAGGISYDFPCYIPCDLNTIATDNGTYIEQIVHGNTIDFEGVAVRVMIWDLHPGERIAVRLRRAVDS